MTWNRTKAESKNIYSQREDEDSQVKYTKTQASLSVESLACLSVESLDPRIEDIPTL